MGKLNLILFLNSKTENSLIIRNLKAKTLGLFLLSPNCILASVTYGITFSFLYCVAIALKPQEIKEKLKLYSTRHYSIYFSTYEQVSRNDEKVCSSIQDLADHDF